MRPVVTLIGRPNVGKSTLFNFLTKSRDALVADYPGLTRDRKYGICERYDKPFVLIDTGGIVEEQDEIEVGMQSQTDHAIDEADFVLHMVDAHDGLLAEDHAIVAMLRKRNINFVMVVNKIDGVDADIAMSDFHQIGAPKLYPIAAKQGRGIEAMISDLFSDLPNTEVQELAEHQEQEDQNKSTF